MGRCQTFQKNAETLTHDAPVNSALLSVITSHFQKKKKNSSNLKIYSPMTLAECQDSMVCGKAGPASFSSVPPPDGTLHFERGASSTLETGPQIISAKSQEEAACRETAQDLNSSALPLDGISIFWKT